LKNVYVGNLPFQVSGSDLEQVFSEFGAVQSAVVVEDRETGRSRGFGFVEMANAADAQAAIEALHDREYQGRRLTVNEARPREPRTGGYGGGRPRGAGYGGGYGRGGYDRGGFGGRY
jgi:RNA recognition motif-containing protein